MRALLLALVLGGCGGSASDVSNGEDGAQGPQGPQGEQGEQGPAGPSGAAYHWVDANGEVVTVGAELGFFDDAGNWWEVDDETAAPTYRTRQVWFDNEDCTGTAWVFGVKPRRPFALYHNVGEFHARSDSAVAETVPVLSSLNLSGDCTPNGEAYYDTGVRLDDAPMVDPIATSWTGPLHPEPL
jgi:hypothetical protein